jgi:hypothetical protein
MLINSATLNAAVVNGAAANVTSLAAVVQASSNTAVSLDAVKRLGAAFASTSSIVGGLVNTIPMHSAVSNNVVAEGLTHQTIPLGGSGVCGSIAMVSLGVTKSLSASGPISTINSAPLGEQVFGGGSSFVGSTASVPFAYLDVIRAVAAHVTCQSSASGSLHLDIPIGSLEGVGAITNVIDGSLHLGIPIAGSGIALSEVIGNVYVVKRVAGAVSTGVTATGNIHIDKPLADLESTASITNVLSANLHLDIPLAAAALAAVSTTTRVLVIDAIDISVTAGSYADVEFIEIFISEAELFYPDEQERLAA